jgi:hypothetical protein
VQGDSRGTLLIGVALRAVAVVSAVLVIFSARGHSSQSQGFGVETASGYQVSNVKYWTDGDGYVEGVDFELDAPARNVSALVYSGGGWLTCHRSGTVIEWSCPATGQPLHMNDADTFQVRAY